MFNLSFSPTSLNLSFSGIIPGLAVVVRVDFPKDEKPITVAVKLDAEVKKS